MSKVVVYTPSKTVKAFMQDESFIRIILGPFGSGKSVGCLMDLWKAAQEQEADSEGLRKTRWVIVRTTNRKLLDTTFKTFREWFPIGVAGEWRVTGKEFTTRYKMEDGTTVVSEFWFRPLEDDKDVDNLASLEVTGAYFNELKEIPKEIFDTMKGRVGRYPPSNTCTRPMIIADSNPPVASEEDWLYKMLEVDKPEDVALFRQPSGLSAEAENLDNLPGGRKYYERMCVGASEDFIRVNVHGEYGQLRGGQTIFGHCFNERIHVGKVAYDPDLTLVLAFDFGLTPACVFMQVSEEGQIRVLGEVISADSGLQRLLVDVIEPLLVNKYEGATVIATGDPAGTHRSDADETTCYDVLSRAGIRAEPCHTNAPVARIGAVENALSTLVRGEAALLIDWRCTAIVKAFSFGYVYKEAVNAKGMVLNVPLKNEHSHVMDALQYGVLYKGRFNVLAYDDDEDDDIAIPVPTGIGGY